MQHKHYHVIIYCPVEAAEAVRKAIADAGAGKIGEKHLLRHGLSGTWKQGGKTTKVARVLGLCHNCGNIRSKQPGLCDVCNVDD